MTMNELRNLSFEELQAIAEAYMVNVNSSNKEELIKKLAGVLGIETSERTSEQVSELTDEQTELTDEQTSEQDEQVSELTDEQTELTDEQTSEQDEQVSEQTTEPIAEPTDEQTTKKTISKTTLKTTQETTHETMRDTTNFYDIRNYKKLLQAIEDDKKIINEDKKLIEEIEKQIIDLQKKKDILQEQIVNFEKEIEKKEKIKSEVEELFRIFATSISPSSAPFQSLSITTTTNNNNKKVVSKNSTFKEFQKLLRKVKNNKAIPLFQMVRVDIIEDKIKFFYSNTEIELYCEIDNKEKLQEDNFLIFIDALLACDEGSLSEVIKYKDETLACDYPFPFNLDKKVCDVSNFSFIDKAKIVYNNDERFFIHIDCTKKRVTTGSGKALCYCEDVNIRCNEAIDNLAFRLTDSDVIYFLKIIDSITIDKISFYKDKNKDNNRYILNFNYNGVQINYSVTSINNLAVDDIIDRRYDALSYNEADINRVINEFNFNKKLSKDKQKEKFILIKNNEKEIYCHKQTLNYIINELKNVKNINYSIDSKLLLFEFENNKKFICRSVE